MTPKAAKTTKKTPKRTKAAGKKPGAPQRPLKGPQKAAVPVPAPKPATKPKTPSQRRLDQNERMRMAAEMRQAGADYHTIAERCGYASANTACQAVNNYIKKQASDTAAGNRAMDAARLDALLTVAYTRALAGDKDMMDRAVSIMERRAALLGYEEESGPAVVNNGVIIVGGEAMTQEQIEKALAGAVEQREIEEAPPDQEKMDEVEWDDFEAFEESLYTPDVDDEIVDAELVEETSA